MLAWQSPSEVRSNQVIAPSPKLFTFYTTSTMAGEDGKPLTSKLHEQATSKGDLSYTGWAAGTLGAAAAPPPAPKLLTPEEAAEAEAEARKLSSGGSAWNAAGTFEERDVSAWARGQLAEALSALRTSSGGVELRVSGRPAVAGDATLRIVRGQRRPGFDWESIEIAFTAAAAAGGGGAGEQVTGKARVPSVSSDDLEDELAVEVLLDAGGPEALRAGAAAAARALLPLIEAELRRLLEAIRQR